MSFPHIYYINLDIRKDRQEHIEKELAKLNIPDVKITRIDAVHKPALGALGCGLSHIKALKAFLESGDNECIILEDDFSFRDEHIDFCKKAIRTIVNAGDKAKYDVLMLASNTAIEEPCKMPYLTRIRYAFTTSGYMITKQFAPILIENFTEACNGLEAAGVHTPAFCIDVYWRKLQETRIFYCLKPVPGYQYGNYSDIERKEVNYGV
jgi:glycosyl transferase family 25